MKRVSIALFLVLCFSAVSANAIYGGETLSYYIDKCDWATVNITPSILDEWYAHPDCTEESAGNFNCECYDGYTMHLSPAINSVGSFNITIKNYWTESEVASSEVIDFSYPSEGMFGRYKNVTINVDKTIERNITNTVEVPVEGGEVVTEVITETITETVEVKVIPQWVWYVLIIAIMTCLFVGFMAGKLS